MTPQEIAALVRDPKKLQAWLDQSAAEQKALRQLVPAAKGI